MRSFKLAGLILMIAVVVSVPPTQAAMVPAGEIGLGLDKALPSSATGIVSLPSDWSTADLQPVIGAEILDGSLPGPGWDGRGSVIPGHQGQTWQGTPRSLLIDHTQQQFLLTQSIVAQGMITPVPEPTSLILLGVGLAGLGVTRKLRRK